MNHKTMSSTPSQSLPMNLDFATTDKEVSLQEYWYIIRRHKWQIIFLSITIATCAHLFTYTLPLIYRATTTMMIDTQQVKVISIEKLYGLNKDNNLYYNSQIILMRSRKIAHIVIKKLNLISHKAFDPTQKKKRFNFSINDGLPERFKKSKTPIHYTDEQRLKIVTGQFLSELKIARHAHSQILNISYESTSPKIARQISIEVGKAYIANGYEEELKKTQHAVGWLTERLSGLKVQLEKSETALIAYRKKEGLLDVKGVLTLSVKSLDDTLNELSSIRSQRIKLQTTYNQLKLFINPSIEDYESVSTVYSNTNVQKAKYSMDNFQDKLIELSKFYGKKHNTMKAAIANFEKSQANYFKTLKNIAKGMQGHYEAVFQNEQSLQKAINETKNDIRNINEKGTRLRDLERVVETNRQLYQTFFTRFKETNETSKMQTANAHIIDEALLPSNPIKISKERIVKMAALFGMILGIILSFIQEALNTTIRNAADIDKKIGLPLFGIVPLLKIRKKNRDRLGFNFIEDKKSNFAEAVRTLRTCVLMTDFDHAKKVIVVTSSIPQEGKTTVSLNLAMALGQQSDNVLLIDGDLRRPSIGKICDISSKNGLSLLVAGKAPIQDCISQHEKWGIDILPCGIVPPNPQELLNSKRFETLLKVLSKKYEFIVIDTAPIQAVSDTQIIARFANEILYVIKADSTHYSVVLGGIDKLKQVDKNISGIILNQHNISKASNYYDNGYYQGYYNNYNYN